MKIKINHKTLVLGMVDARLNGKQLAERTGLSELTISKVKNGGSCDIDTAYKIAEALNISARELIVFEDEERAAENGKQKEGDCD